MSMASRDQIGSKQPFLAEERFQTEFMLYSEENPRSYWPT